MEPSVSSVVLWVALRNNPGNNPGNNPMKIKCIALSNGGVTWVDPEDFESLNKWRWTAANEKSVYRHDIDSGHTVRLHRQLFELEYGDTRQVDHINHNPFDNRRQNLRIVTNSQNQQNRSRDNTGRGVYVAPQRDGSIRWRTQHMLNGKFVSAGTYATFEEADMAAREWRQVHMPYSNEDTN